MPRLSILSVVVLGLISLFKLSDGAFVNLKVYEYDWLQKILTDKINNVNVRPTIVNTSEPIEISASLYVRNFELIDDKKQEFSIQLILRQEWEDDRLAYSKYNPVQLRQLKYLTLLDKEKIWTPDTFFKNEVSSSLHSNMKPNGYIRIYPNGTVFQSTRITLRLTCPSLLRRYFPFDSPLCSVQLASYAFARDDLIYKWKPVPHPISLSNVISLSPEFVFDSVTTNYCDSQAATGVFSCLLAEFQFSRNRSFYLTQCFIPMINHVIVTWLSFLLDFRGEKTFLMRGILTLVTLTTAYMRLTNMGLSFPKMGSTTALDCWNGISLTFVFYGLVEFILVHYLDTHEFSFKKSEVPISSSAKGSKRNSTLDDIEMRGTNGDEGQENFEVERKKSVEVQTLWSSKLAPEKIEKWTLMLYPVLYAGFSFIFWIACSSSGDGH